MNRDEILRTAAQYVTNDRQRDHGDAERNFGHIANLWSSYLGIVISPYDVALMMVLLKVVRAKGTPMHLDNWVDIAGYAACGGEIVTREWPEAAVNTGNPPSTNLSRSAYSLLEE